MVAVQSTGCGPIVRAFEAGQRDGVEPWENVTNDIHGVRVPSPLGGTSEADYDRMMDINMKGVFFCIHEVAPIM